MKIEIKRALYSNAEEVAKITKIAILGSTGSIGTQTLDIIRGNRDRFEPTVLIAGSNVALLAKQALDVRPAMVVIADESRYRELSDMLAGTGIEVAAGATAVGDAMTRDDVDIVVTATVGYSGLVPTLRAIDADKDIALANKETLVVAGELVKKKLLEHRSRVIPVDSEHSAIYQCLVGEDRASISRLIITASGGPFLHVPAERLSRVTAADALHHPNWQMGAKITIDSATMMNKAFEIIEARWLFDISPEKIVPVVHPQSIVHSMVEFVDGAVKAQLGIPDMHLPISYALAGATRIPIPNERCLSLADYSKLTFETPDYDRFPCLTLANRASSEGGTTACVINAANEIAVASFLKGRIGFTDIYRLIMGVLERVKIINNPTFEDYVSTNTEARRVAEELVNNHGF